MATCPRMNFIKGSCPGVVVQGGISHEKMYGEQKLRGANSLGGILWVAIVQVETLGDNCPGGFYWGKLYGSSCTGGINQEKMYGEQKLRGKFPWGEFCGYQLSR